MQFMPLHRTQEIARYVHASGNFPPYEFASSIVGFDTSAAALTAHAEPLRCTRIRFPLFALKTFPGLETASKGFQTTQLHKQIRKRQNTPMLPIQILPSQLPVSSTDYSPPWHPQIFFTPTRRIASSPTPATFVTFLLATAAINLPIFLLLTMWFPLGLLALFHPWLAVNHPHLMALILHFILKRCFLIFKRSLASVSDAWSVPLAPSLPTSMLSSGPAPGESQHAPCSLCALRRRPGAQRARHIPVRCPAAAGSRAGDATATDKLATAP
jgi:hypothetical protein